MESITRRAPTQYFTGVSLFRTAEKAQSGIDLALPIMVRYYHRTTPPHRSPDLL